MQDARPLLLIEDDDSLAWAIRRFLERSGTPVVHASRGADALALLDRARPRGALVDVRLPDYDGIELANELQRRAPGSYVVIMTALDDVEVVARAVRAGVADYLVKPLDLEALVRTLQAIEARQAHAAELSEAIERGPRPLVGAHPSIRRVRHELALLAERRDVSLLVHGETGTGKDVVAHALHVVDRSPGSFVDVNCAAVAESLFESELFGHESGAFTGARGAKPGVLELAHGGTLFLDEVGELPAALQPKLLRAIEERAFRRVGGVSSRSFDARLVSATNRDVGPTSAGTLRMDLYYRLAAHVVTLPPLRERGEDVLLLAEHFLRATPARPGSFGKLALAEQTRRVFLEYAWPGNVRELRNVVARAALLATDGVIRPVHLPAELFARTPPAISAPPISAVRPVAKLQDVEQAHIAAVFEQHHGNLAATARALGMSRTTLRDRLRRGGRIPPGGGS
jgi:DNA-binding NtrC family response regulator